VLGAAYRRARRCGPSSRGTQQSPADTDSAVQTVASNQMPVQLETEPPRLAERLGGRRGLAVEAAFRGAGGVLLCACVDFGAFIQGVISYIYFFNIYIYIIIIFF